ERHAEEGVEAVPAVDDRFVFLRAAHSFDLLQPAGGVQIFRPRVDQRRNAGQADVGDYPEKLVQRQPHGGSHQRRVFFEMHLQRQFGGQFFAWVYEFFFVPVSSARAGHVFQRRFECFFDTEDFDCELERATGARIKGELQYFPFFIARWKRDDLEVIEGDVQRRRFRHHGDRLLLLVRRHRLDDLVEGVDHGRGGVGPLLRVRHGERQRPFFAHIESVDELRLREAFFLGRQLHGEGSRRKRTVVANTDGGRSLLPHDRLRGRERDRFREHQVDVRRLHRDVEDPLVVGLVRLFHVVEGIDVGDAAEVARLRVGERERQLTRFSRAKRAALLGQRLVARHDDRERAGVPARDEAAGWAVAEVLHRDGEGVGNALRDGGGGEVARVASGRMDGHFGDRQVNRGGGDVLVGRRGVVVLVDLGDHMGAIDRDGPFVVAWELVDVVEAD